MNVTIVLSVPDDEAYSLLTAKIVELQMETNERIHPDFELIAINETVKIIKWEKE
jgi:hypothetical protein